ncbi:VIT domain-containing protein [Psychroserpens sp.]
MKKSVFLFTLMYFTSYVFSQTMPEVKVGEDHLRLSVLNIKSIIVGNTATTTYDMLFFNPQDRVLEGELAFPLGQGQAVTDFAMDVNGILRTAVIVEKELGRIAFENTTRQTIDPGLLEKTKGNNYKARVYPIPANGSKRIVITFEHKLFSSEGYHLMEIPLSYKNKLDNFSVSIERLSEDETIKIENTIYKGLEFKSLDGKMVANFSKNKFAPHKTIKLRFPITDVQTVTLYKDYFNIYRVFNVAPRPKAKPEKVTVFWDASYSMQFRKLNKELQLLDQYFEYLNTVDVRLVVFSNTIKKDSNFKIENGNWNSLKQAINTVVYDGGTSYLNLENHMSQDNLFFTDGMDNLGDFNLTKSALTTINAVGSSNHEKLRNISNHSGAQYINLNLQSLSNAFQLLINETYKFLGYKANDAVYDVFPKAFTSVQGDFSVSGRFSDATQLKLFFGYNFDVIDTYEASLSAQENNPIVKRLWANQKLSLLTKNNKENKDAIIDLAKRYNLISDYTSMIVLDRIEDYVRYKIEPPKELMSAYKELIQIAKEDDSDRLEDLNDRREELFEGYQDLMEWYGKDFSSAIIENVKKEPTQLADNTTVQNQQESTTQQQVNEESTTETNPVIYGEESSVTTVDASTELNGEERTITGVVTSADDGLSLPGLNVMIKGTSRGVQTDFDGIYSIKVSEGETLVFSFISMKSTERVVGSSKIMDVALAEDAAALDEVVITGYRGATNNTTISSSIATVKSEAIDQVPIISVDQMLQGQLAGVNVSTGSGQPGQSATIIIRGRNSLSGDTEPLFIIDGVLVDQDDFRSINQNDIESFSVLKDAAAMSIYGNRASNGVIVITTKEGLEAKKEDIETLNEKINSEFELKPWTPNAEYIRTLSKIETADEAFKTYIKLRAKYHNVPTFFLDVADFFESRNENEIAIQVLTNLIEIDIDNHELMRALAYKLEAMKNYQAAVYVYEAVLELRPEHPQSYRDLALVYEETKHYQKAFDLLFKITNGDLLEKDEDERFFGIEQIAFVEACHLIKLHRKELNITEEQLKLFKDLQVDIRVVIDWNQDNTDIDLWIMNPKNEKIYFGNTKSNNGGRLSEDLTEGYGPEEFLLKNTIKGNYEVIVNYFGNDDQKISGPTTLKITMFTNYGTKDETKHIQIMRLSKNEDEYEVGTVSFNK